MRDALASDPAGLRHQHPAFCFREKPGSGVFLALTGSLPCASNDRPPPARCRGELCSHPLHRGAWDESRDTPAPAGGPVSPQIPVGPGSGSPSSGPACSFSAGERGSPRAWPASLQRVEQAASPRQPRGGSALGARPTDAARLPRLQPTPAVHVPRAARRQGPRHSPAVQSVRPAGHSTASADVNPPWTVPGEARFSFRERAAGP